MNIENLKYMIMAQDMNRAIKFYQETFDLNVMFQSEHWSELNLGQTVLALHGGGDGKQNKTGLIFGVKDIHAAVSNAVKHGAKVLRQPEDRAGEPIWLADIIDPEGNEVCLSQQKS